MSRLGPGDVPRSEPVHVIHGGEAGLTDEGHAEDDLTVEMIEEIVGKLAQLRRPFPADMIEKLPKPLWKNAWEGKKAARCNICHGYHVLEDCIHLDYVGHANTTNRLLETDPMWDWEPMAYTPEGLPLFTKNGGLWIRLTICGVTRLGYGDGKEPKEIIGDAIRNAAMRFGVALDLWSKIDLHADRNPGDGETSQRERRPSRGGDSGRSSGDEGAGGDGRGDVAVASDEARSENQDALDSLGSVCDENGYDRRTMRNEYAKWAAKKRYKDRELLTADSDRIIAFAAKLIEDATPDRDADGGTAAGVRGTAESERGGGDATDASDEAQANNMGPDHGTTEGPTEETSGAVDMSDVEKQPGDMF